MTILLTDLIYHQPKFLTNEECDFLIEESNKRHNEYLLESCPEASTGINTESTFLKVDLAIGTEAWNIVHTATEKMINQYHDYLDTFDAFHTLFRGALLYSHVYRLLKYEKGASIHPHSDHDPYVYGSCTFNLNDNYSGGEFAWFKGKHTLNLGKGDALIFPADYFWVHEVKPITSGVRYSTNSFLQRIPQPVKLEMQKFLEMLSQTPHPDPIVQKQIDTFYKIENKGHIV